MSLRKADPCVDQGSMGNWQKTDTLLNVPQIFSISPSAPGGRTFSFPRAVTGRTKTNTALLLVRIICAFPLPGSLIRFCKITTILFIHIAWVSLDNLQSRDSVVYCQESLYAKCLLCSFGVSDRDFVLQDMFPGLCVHELYFFLNFILNSTFINSISEEPPNYIHLYKTLLSF